MTTRQITKDTDPATLRTLGERLKWARLQAGLSQPQLAGLAGVSQGTIGNVESGERKKPRELVAIAKALNVDPGWFDTGNGSRTAAAAPKKGAHLEALSTEEQELIAHFRHLLGSDRRAKIAEIAKLAREREEQKREMLSEAGLDKIMERAAHASRRGERASASVDPDDPRLRQRALPLGDGEQ